MKPDVEAIRDTADTAKLLLRHIAWARRLFFETLTPVRSRRDIASAATTLDCWQMSDPGSRSSFDLYTEIECRGGVTTIWTLRIVWEPCWLAETSLAVASGDPDGPRTLATDETAGFEDFRTFTPVLRDTVHGLAREMQSYPAY